MDHKDGPGTLILTGNNTYSGRTTISAGTLQPGSAGGFSPNSEFTVNSKLDLNGFNSTVASLSGTVLNNGAVPATLTVGNDKSNSTFSGVLENGKSVLQLTKSGTSVLTLTGANTYTDGTTISSGTLHQ
jgi:autotransporter-associated beta strand protein